jgi:TolB-like protein/tetratricopeptide (TPR) repeat protein
MTSFLTELRRRHVFRVAAGYVVAAWLIVQGAAALAGMLTLPEWFGGLVLALVALGFPIALVLAWAFEMTPDGVKRTSADAGGAPARGLGGTDAALLAVLVGVLGVSVYQAARPRTAAPAVAAAADALSVAVLPFVNMSSDPEQEYFSDGLSEELLNQLAQIEALQVIGRTSSFAFKGRNEDLRTIGEQLNAAHLLEGSVRKSGDRLRITAQLIDARTGVHLWSETYDRQLTDVFAIQDEIAVAVADALSVTLGIARAPVPAGGAGDIEAYDLFLRAREVHRSASSGAEFDRAVGLYRGVLALDPSFARAREGLALLYLSQTILAPERRDEAVRALESIAAEALAATPDDASSHAAVALLHLQRREWADADAAFARAAALAPMSADVSAFHALMVMGTGRTEDAIALARAAVRNDPLSRNSSNLLQQALTIAGRREEAEAEHQRGLARFGAVEAIEHTALMRVWSDGDAAVTRAAFDRYIDSQTVPFPPSLALREAFEDREAALALVRAAGADPAYQDPTRQSFIARYAGHFGDPQLALAAARRAYVEIGSAFVAAIWFPDMAAARREPAFKDLVRDLGLVDYWRATGDWGDFCRPLGPDDFVCE